MDWPAADKVVKEAIAIATNKSVGRSVRWFDHRPRRLAASTLKESRVNVGGDFNARSRLLTLSAGLIRSKSSHPQSYLQHGMRAGTVAYHREPIGFYDTVDPLRIPW